eukprot:gene7736-12206_t
MEEENELEKLEVDQEYFFSYNDLDVHSLMIKDDPRTNGYKEAIIQNKNLFKDKVVLDIGAGTGILSMFSALYGEAKKVYAVEASEVHSLASQLIEDNGLSNIVEVVHGRIEEIILKEKVDMGLQKKMINILKMGFYLFHESMLNSVLFGRDTWLKKDGILFPNRAKVFSSPVNMKNEFTEKVSYWNDVHGLNFSRLGNFFEKDLFSKPYVGVLSTNQLLSKPEIVLDIDLMKISVKELRLIQSNSRFKIKNENNLTMNGISIWFDVYFNDFILSTSPFNPPTHWKQTVILLPGIEGFDVTDNDEIPIKFTFEQDFDNYRLYNLSIEFGE